MKGILTNLSKSKASGFREKANGVEVAFIREPTVGESFQCTGEGVEFGTRLITTSFVVSMSHDERGTTFVTESGSSYSLDYTEEKLENPVGKS